MHVSVHQDCQVRSPDHSPQPDLYNLVQLGASRTADV